MSKKKVETEIIDDDGLNLREFVDSILDALEMQESYLKQIDWTKEEKQKDKNDQYTLSVEVYDVALTNAEIILSKSNGNPPKYAEDILKRITKMVEVGMKRMKSYTDTSKKKKGTELMISSFASELSFITRIGKDQAKINKRLSKIVRKETEITFTPKSGHFISLVNRPSIEEAVPEVKEYIDNKINNYLNKK